MREFGPSPEADNEHLPSRFSVRFCSPKEEILKKISRGFSCAYLVDEDYNLLIGISGKHAELIRNLAPGTKILQKGEINGKNKKISYYGLSSSSQDLGATSQDVIKKINSASRDSINEALGIDF